MDTQTQANDWQIFFDDAEAILVPQANAKPVPVSTRLMVFVRGNVMRCHALTPRKVIPRPSSN